MCGFLVHTGKGNNHRIQRRGPDLTNTLQREGLAFVHNLLAVTGDFTPQPFVDGGIVCLYNGQIYNHRYAQSDGEVLIPLYRKHGPAFVRMLDGEFAIALYDFEQDLFVFATDPFKTKPLFINGVQCASYRSGVGGEPATPNEVIIKNRQGRLLDRMVVREWDLTQHKDDYCDWIDAFEFAVAKRAKHDCFIGLSSGYDSGAIACALQQLGVRFKAFCDPREENPDILRARQTLIEIETFEPASDLMPWLAENVDNEPYTILVDGKTIDKRLLEDGATLGIATIARRAHAENRRVHLSGQGADEILSDYSPWPSQSELKGTFPDTLTLWTNFNRGCQESYLMKEEYASGAFGIESRYPFLDSRVVQEFLWLSASAKNRHYKAPLHEYFVRHQFPFEADVKRGFHVAP